MRPRKCCPRVDPKFYQPKNKLVHDIHPHPTNYGTLDKDQVRYSIKNKFKSNYDSSNKEKKSEDQNKNVILNLCRLSHDFLLQRMMFLTWCVDIYIYIYMNGGFREECGGGCVLTSGVLPQFMYGALPLH